MTTTAELIERVVAAYHKLGAVADQAPPELDEALAEFFNALADAGLTFDEIAALKTRLAEQEAVIAEMRRLIEELANDVEASVRAEYGWPSIHPVNQRRFDRDMEIVVEARAFLNPDTEVTK